MKISALYGTALAIALSFSATSFAQSPTQGDSSNASTGSNASSSQQYGQGGSKHCDQLSGAEKQTCLQDEGAKTERKEEPAAAAPAAGASGATSSSDRDTAPDAKGVNETQKND